MVDAIDEELYKTTGKQHLFYCFFYDFQLAQELGVDMVDAA
ncbi:MAG: hypothetical protein RR141_07615 [Rikenellaceae bacterium]